MVGLSNGDIGDFVGEKPNSYSMCYGGDCWLAGETPRFEWPEGAIKPKWKGRGDVVGCGLLLNPEKKVSIFFTVNGILMGQFSFLCDSKFMV